MNVISWMSYRRSAAWLVIGFGLVFAGAACTRNGNGATDATASAPTAVTAMGRIVPGRAVISVAAAPGERLQRLLVKEREKVAQSAVLAYLATYDVRKAELGEATATLPLLPYQSQHHSQMEPAISNRP